MSLFAELMSFKGDLPDDDLCFSSWPGFEQNDDPAFGDLLEAIPSYSSSYPTTMTRHTAASGSLSSDAAEPTSLQKGRSLSSELEPDTTKKLSAAERKLASNRKAQKRFRAKQKWVCCSLCSLTRVRRFKQPLKVRPPALQGAVARRRSAVA